MVYNVKVQPAGVSFKSEGNLLEDALSQSIHLEYSCKTGECGTCNADIVCGEVENEHGEVVSNGAILTCQSKAKSDVILKANYYPELVNIKQKTVPCKVASFEYCTDDIVVIKFRFPPTAKFDYLPGQYVDLSFKGVKRSYSIANAKSATGELELHIRKVHNGKMSELLFGQLKENQLMRLEGPKGTFFVKEGNKPLILIATGTGIAPIKAIVEELLTKEDSRSIDIFWGMQFAKELYCDELIKLSKQNKHINFTPVLSKESTANCETGYVQSAVVKAFNSLKGKDVYACGSINMIENSRELFLKHNLAEGAFHSDAFVATK
ncbi:FAD-binding oxidoreductase [Vibrio genomosp. F10 str. 9ZC157]|uniref:CDP-6-deoxy-delta-3,4-glucoseen reductase n=1 Tax=Vibrio genomosp. F10 str. ZF-129 TaxID=1187848 RepID=A0A1E5BD88_9VIBR|nr:FAD-binding oxidoreductase [Vibrio genomosp. F10]OEE33108.1 CDP-6-deoxy-delta-3,4-glucoseen reductase [Vibrio genomosp. F10 str. ZF-129]OEE95609.1 CDP-6-deoxy-delta-3,4-glucoseen reductase [Vibrio genomosp. F10 str. 9ZC157]